MTTAREDRTMPATPLTAFAERVLRLQALQAELDAAQWMPSHTPRPRDDTSERSQGGHGDPTSSIVVDDRRLALRAAMDAADHALVKAERVLSAATAHLQLAADRWHGDE
jgi:hypothetical protein